MPTPHAYLFDAIRTPRGRGKASGSLHPVRPLDLLKTLFDELRERHDLDTSQVDDVLLGCVTPVKEQGGNIARTAPLYAGWDLDLPGAQLNRFCASGLEAVNLAVMKVRSGWEYPVVVGASTPQPIASTHPNPSRPPIGGHCSPARPSAAGS